LEYRWDWENDGTWDTGWLASATTTHTWTTPGAKTIALQVRDQFQCPAGTWARWISATVTTTVNVINHPPVAEANGPYTVNDGQAVAFSSAGSGDPDVGDSITYAWDFMNDGGAPDSTAPNPSYTYPTWGTYTARLTVTDSFGLTATDTASVRVRAYPIANAGPDQFMLVGETVSFNGGASTDPDGTIVAYDWNFGDGSAHGTGVTTTHLYAAAGTYNVVLTVTDNDGLTDTDTAVVNYMTSCDGINYLKTVVNGMTIKASVKTGLNSKLTNANTLCVNGQKAAAIKTMNNFITQCNTQRGLALTNTQADTLVNWANRIIAALRRM
jgi:PKD repeat protein